MNIKINKINTRRSFVEKYYSHSSHLHLYTLRTVKKHSENTEKTEKKSIASVMKLSTIKKKTPLKWDLNLILMEFFITINLLISNTIIKYPF